MIFFRLPEKCWNWVSFLIFHFLTLKLSKTKEILFRWFVLCAWQRNYGHLLCGPLNQARRRCKYFVTQVWTWSFPVCIFCEVRTFCQFNVTDTGKHFLCLCGRVVQQCPSIRVEYVREIYQHCRVGLGGIWAQRGPCRSNTVYWCSQDLAPPPHEQYNANLVLTHSRKELEMIPALPYLSNRNLTFSLLLNTSRQEVRFQQFALLLISWTQKFEDLEFFMSVYHTLHLIEVMYSNNLLLIVMQLQWSEWFVNVLKQNVWGEQRGSCWTHGHQAPLSR